MIPDIFGFLETMPLPILPVEEFLPYPYLPPLPSLPHSHLPPPAPWHTPYTWPDTPPPPCSTPHTPSPWLPRAVLLFTGGTIEGISPNQEIPDTPPWPLLHFSD